MKMRILLLMILGMAENILMRPTLDAENSTEIIKISEALNATKSVNLSEVDAPKQELQNRYFMQQNKTSSRSGRASFSNDYSQLITKRNILTLHDTNNRTVDSIITSSSSSSSSSSSDASLSSKPIHFTKDLTVPPSFIKHKSTTKRTIQNSNNEQENRLGILKLNNWSNLELDPVELDKPKKAIHKVFTKWTDNLEQANISPDQYQLVYSSLLNNSYFDALPSMLSQSMMEKLPPQPTQIVYSTVSTRKPQIFIKRKPFDENDPNPPGKYNNPPETVKYETLKQEEKCTPVRIFLNNTLKNNNKNKGPEKKENCNNEVDIQILSELNNNSEFDDIYDDNDNKLDVPQPADKFPIAQNDFSSGTGQSVLSNLNPIPVLTSLSQLLPGSQLGGLGGGSEDSGGKKKHKKKGKKHKKKKKGEGEGGGGVLGTGMSTTQLMSTIVSYLVLFNPLNFGIFGLMGSPMMATITIGICIAMYRFMSNQQPPIITKRPIVIKNKIKHYPIPVHVTHHYKNHEPIPVRKPQYHISEDPWSRSHEAIKPPDYYIDWQPSDEHRSKTKNYKFKLL